MDLYVCSPTSFCCERSTKNLANFSYAGISLWSFSYIIILHGCFVISSELYGYSPSIFLSTYWFALSTDNLIFCYFISSSFSYLNLSGISCSIYSYLLLYSDSVSLSRFWCIVFPIIALILLSGNFLYIYEFITLWVISSYLFSWRFDNASYIVFCK